MSRPRPHVLQLPGSKMILATYVEHAAFEKEVAHSLLLWSVLRLDDLHTLLDALLPTGMPLRRLQIFSRVGVAAGLRAPPVGP